MTSYQKFDPRLADAYDDIPRRWERVLLYLLSCVIWPSLPSRAEFRRIDLSIAQESLKRKQNKLYYQGILRARD